MIAADVSESHGGTGGARMRGVVKSGKLHRVRVDAGIVECQL